MGVYSELFCGGNKDFFRNSRKEIRNFRGKITFLGSINFLGEKGSPFGVTLDLGRIGISCKNIHPCVIKQSN